jgi:hypothetical protein
MKCPRCQHENAAGAKFCEECAAPLAQAAITEQATAVLLGAEHVCRPVAGDA